jgi:uncharacterized heparinase superfamily protein
MNRWTLLFHTVRYLKPKQIFYQIYYRIRKPRLNPQPKPVLRGTLGSWSGAAFLNPATDDGRTFVFLGQVANFDGNWNDPSFSKLWLYNLHYQDDLNAKGAESREPFCAHLVDEWIAGNPPIAGNGWEPYCISLRIVNWVKFFSRLPAEKVRAEWLGSLAQQVNVLEQRLEFHILANHLFANAKALVFVGTYIGGEQGDRWLRIGLKLLDWEIPEQFLADGAHFERSPMYQAILLWDLADLLALGHATNLPEISQRMCDWQARLQSGFEWSQAMAHPDGGIAFFNDATFGIAPSIGDIERYMAFLGVPIATIEKSGMLECTLLQPSGYGVLKWPEDHRLLVDLAMVGPDYQSGHAHADTLSCELSLYGHRVLVNPGISQYGEGSERHQQRGTAAHNTVEIDGENSSEVWAGFRMARRARPFDVSLCYRQGSVLVSGSHDGYRRLAGKVTHNRSWRASDGRLEVTDVLTGSFREALAHWHFHPDVTVRRAGDFMFTLRLPCGQVVGLEVDGGKTEIAESKWHPGFGISKQSRKLIVAFSGHKLITRISWGSV